MFVFKDESAIVPGASSGIGHKWPCFPRVTGAKVVVSIILKGWLEKPSRAADPAVRQISTRVSFISGAYYSTNGAYLAWY